LELHIPLLCVQWKTPDDRQRKCPKNIVSFRNKFQKLVHLVGFIIRNEIKVFEIQTVVKNSKETAWITIRNVNF
jgi:hypothetical protein